jgi:hypothetical protein
MQELIAELSSASERFRELWSRAEVGYWLESTTSATLWSATFIFTGIG